MNTLQHDTFIARLADIFDRAAAHTSHKREAAMLIARELKAAGYVVGFAKRAARPKD